jgi:hypothetical protein
MTLRELLKDKTLPVKVKHPMYITKFQEVIAIKEFTNKSRAIGFHSDGEMFCANLITEGYSLYTEPPKLVKKIMWQVVYEKYNLYSGYDLYPSKEEALKQGCAVGVVEVTVEVKSE